MKILVFQHIPVEHPEFSASSGVSVVMSCMSWSWTRVRQSLIYAASI